MAFAGMYAHGPSEVRGEQGKVTKLQPAKVEAVPPARSMAR